MRGEAPSGGCKVVARSSARAFKLFLLLVRRFPTENGHGNAVRTAQIPSHLLLQIEEGIEAQMVVEPFLIVSVASLDLSVMPRRSRTNQLVLDLVTVTEYVKRMRALGIEEVSKFRAVVGLNCLGGVTKKGNGSLHKVYGRIATVFLVGIDKPLSGRFFNHRVLIKFLTVFPYVTGLGDEFNIHLPLDTDHRGGIIRLIVQ